MLRIPAHFYPPSGRVWGFWLAAWLATATGFGAAPREFINRNWTREDGLPANTVTAIAQTPEGYLWVGTFGGLARFDGVRFVKVDLRRLAGLTDPLITSLATDSQGVLWIGAGDGSLVRYNRVEGVRRMPPTQATTDQPLRRIVEARDGALWMLNFEGVLSRLSGGEFQKITVRPELKTLVADARQRVWAATGTEVFQVESGQLTPLALVTNQPEFKLEALAAAQTGGCWLATRDQVRRFDAGQFRESRPLPTQRTSPISALVEDHDGNVWVATYGDGLFVCDTAGECRTLNRMQGLPTDLVRCLFADHEGNLWAGTEGRGLICIRRATFLSYTGDQGMLVETALCAEEDAAGRIWVGTNGEGVYCLGDGEVKRYDRAEGLTNPFVWSLHCSRDGTVWAGTWGGGLFRWNGHRFVDTRSEYGALPVVLALHEDAQGTIWTGQRLPQSRQIEVLQGAQHRIYSVPGSAPGIEVRGIAETPDGGLWFATAEDGLICWRHDQFTFYGTNQGLPPGSISTLHVDDDGHLWGAVAGAGLVLRLGDRFWTMASTSALLGDNVSQITDDGIGYLWCGTRDGVVRLEKQQLHRMARGEQPVLSWRRFSKADGLPSNECSGSGVRARDGRIWFPTAHGIAVVDPRRVIKRRAPPRAVIEAILFTGRDEATPHSLPVPPATPSRSPAGLRLPPGVGQLDIVYTALGAAAAANQVQFRYQLHGLDQAVVDTGFERVVRYHYLPPGDYQFNVAARNEGELWSDAGATLAFSVPPYFWQTLWFRGLALVAVAGGLAGGVALAVRRRHRLRIAQLEHLNALERERSRIAQDIHDDLGANLTRIVWLGELSATDKASPERIEAHARRITECARQTIRALDEIVWAVNPRNDSLQSLAQYLTHYAHECFAPTTVRCRLEMPSNLPAVPLPSETRHNLFLAVKEALHNVLKHAAASQVRICVSVAGGRLHLLVEDNGRGFSTPVEATRRVGQGLSNLRRRIESIGGVFACRTAPGHGTTISFTVRLNQPEITEANA
ncbi:MAG TPA: two-component regulator propeller domain-containing protein [Verrucomicrobiota bacterium]|nr:two-component regulator propeller domain-containing protein [Verrucomicrobiota bacterium]HNT13260.1 two-component regulator propeller domain-containing protein [Verrucomicrobiota bacterium]